MGTRVHYPEEITRKAIKMKVEGFSNQQIKSALEIRNKTQIMTWMRWCRNGKECRFSQSVAGFEDL